MAPDGESIYGGQSMEAQRQSRVEITSKPQAGSRDIELKVDEGLHSQSSATAKNFTKSLLPEPPEQCYQLGTNYSRALSYGGHSLWSHHAKAIA